MPLLQVLTFRQWVERLIDQRFGTATALAAAIGMELSPFTRGVKAGTLNLVNLLKLAQVAEEQPSKVLRLARKTAEADLLEALYGSGREALTPSQRELIETWEQISDEVRPALAVVLRHARDATAAGAEKTPPHRAARRPGRRAAARSIAEFVPRSESDR